MSTFRDGYTQMLRRKINDWGLDRIYEIEDNIRDLERNEPAIIGYLKDIRFSMPLGMAIRRYLCEKFGNRLDGSGYVFSLSSSKRIEVTDYMREGYDIQDDDIKEYIDVIQYINETYNGKGGSADCPDLTKAEIRRLLRVKTSCIRSKMFLLSFALNMNSDEMHKFLTDVLAEQTYNYRQPEEIIAYFCQSHGEVNSYSDYKRILAEYEKLSGSIQPDVCPRDNYTAFAAMTVKTQINTENELLEFLVANRANFAGYSQTAYSEFMRLYTEALSETKIQTFSNDEYIFSSTVETAQLRAEQEARINRAIELQQATNTEQLAKKMLECIPRHSYERVRNGKTITTNDFIPIYNGESGQQSRRIQTTTLPKEITVNLLMKDRLDDLIKQIKPVERKDLVFLKFYVFSQELQNRGGRYTIEDYTVFCDECNDMLLRCGMSKLYPANRFENLIMLSLLASNPFEMFENIIEYSFINEAALELG